MSFGTKIYILSVKERKNMQSTKLNKRKEQLRKGGEKCVICHKMPFYMIVYYNHSISIL